MTDATEDPYRQVRPGAPDVAAPGRRGAAWVAGVAILMVLVAAAVLGAVVLRDSYEQGWAPFCPDDDLAAAMGAEAEALVPVGATGVVRRQLDCDDSRATVVFIDATSGTAAGVVQAAATRGWTPLTPGCAEGAVEGRAVVLTVHEQAESEQSAAQLVIDVRPGRCA